MFWQKHRVLVTGGNGFLGSYVSDLLRSLGCEHLFTPRSSEFDLRKEAAIKQLFKLARPHLVIHLAGRVGGIGANRKSPGRFFYDNAIMGLQLMELARQAGVRKFVAIGSVCAYPKFTQVPFRETDLWEGYPEESNGPYGMAKKMMLVQAQAYREQYGFNAIYLLLANLFGPGQHGHSSLGHVIPSLIKKCIEARKNGKREIVLWGDGSPSREFLYVEDAARGIILASEKYDGSAPVNLGTGEEISIRELAALVAEEVGYVGRIVWDTSFPNGQPRRSLDVTLADKLFGFRATTSLREGLIKTIMWRSSLSDPISVVSPQLIL